MRRPFHTNYFGAVDMIEAVLPQMRERGAGHVGVRKDLIKQFADHLPGDPRRVGEAVLMLVGLEDPPLRLLLGTDVLQATRAKLAELGASIDAWEHVTVDVGPRPAPATAPGA